MIIQEYNFPNFEEIQKLEKKANKEGSGIKAEDLKGFWKFQYVYKRGAATIDNISSSLLQTLCASLELKNYLVQDELATFEIRNSIKFGILSIVFSGNAYLKGYRPLLNFYFKKLHIKVFNIPIIDKPLEEISHPKMPFFSFIAPGENKKWVCARGKGGGLAIWIKG